VVGVVGPPPRKDLPEIIATARRAPRRGPPRRTQAPWHGRQSRTDTLASSTTPRSMTVPFAGTRVSSANSRNTFLRAWAPHTLFQLARQHREYAADAKAAVVRALTDPAPSVRARARRTLDGA